MKAGAIETAAGVNGQIMPPVMGAAAFLMAEYVGVSYARGASSTRFLPAFLTYIALFYIVASRGVQGGHRAACRGAPDTPVHRPSAARRS